MILVIIPRQQPNVLCNEMDQSPLPLGKLPPEILAKIITRAPISDPRLILGPGIGLDCAVVALGDTCLVFKSDPITFATDEIGWYIVQINANDIATTGAVPRWFLVTALLPEGQTTPESVERLSQQVYDACQSLGISMIGGHTEITYGIERPILAGTMIGEVPCDQLITPKGASPGDRVLLTKGVPIEGTAILAREFPHKLRSICTEEELEEAYNYLYSPGISVVRDAQLAIQAGSVTAMHDPTEGGLAGALWELAQACGQTLVIDPGKVPIPDVSQKVCRAFDIDPFATIASGALLVTASPEDALVICDRLGGEGIPCTEIGVVKSGTAQVLQATPEGVFPISRPQRDEIARVFEG
jgi:hydrogenase maturation factor